MTELENKMSAALQDITAERQRQITEENWTLEHDDQYDDRELAKAAACYANPIAIVIDGDGLEIGVPNIGTVPVGWPEGWTKEWWKPSTRRRDLVKAAALIVAEIERIDRADDVARCPICDGAFKPDDICATDITEGCCHAECLAGSPVVDLETGDEGGGEVSTYVYSEFHKGGA